MRLSNRSLQFYPIYPLVAIHTQVSTGHSALGSSKALFKNQKEHRRLTVFRLGALAGSLLTHY
jgi:hypothetical protein